MIRGNVMRSRKGISPILATLLLIVIAVAAIVVTYAWIITYMGGTTGQAGVFLQKDAVYWKNSTHLVIYVRNTGTSDAQIDKVYMGTSSMNLVPQTFTSDVGAPHTVAKDGGVIELTVMFSWTGGTTYYFRIVPKVGNALTFQEKAPS